MSTDVWDNALYKSSLIVTGFRALGNISRIKSVVVWITFENKKNTYINLKNYQESWHWLVI